MHSNLSLSQNLALLCVLIHPHDLPAVPPRNLPFAVSDMNSPDMNPRPLTPLTSLGSNHERRRIRGDDVRVNSKVSLDIPRFGKGTTFTKASHSNAFGQRPRREQRPPSTRDCFRFMESSSTKPLKLGLYVQIQIGRSRMSMVVKGGDEILFLKRIKRV